MNDWKHCPFCGHELGPADAVCPACHAAVRSDAASPESEGTPTQPDADLDHLVADLRESLAPSLQVLRLLGRGGMGMVFLARDPALKRNVVVKVLSPALARDTTARKRFEREAESAAAVSHPNIIGVYQVGALARSNTSYFVMQHVDGPTLAEESPEGTRMLEARARVIVGEVAAALAAAHTRGLVHRDIKPSNIMLEQQSGRAIVLDFGISAVVSREGDARSTKLTDEGSSIGTPQYMSPEQAAGETVTEQSDVYSLGLVAFELLAGRPPFVAANPMALIAAHLKDTPPKVRDLRPDVDPDLAELVDACLAKDPRERPTARVIADALHPQGGTAVEWPPPGLETIKGAARAHLDRLASFVGAELIYILTLTFALIATEGEAAIPGMLGLFLGVGVLATAVVYSMKARRLPTQVRHARRAGFPLDVLLDVAIDPATDTELLINRRGPFARLSAEQITRLLRDRRLRFLLQGMGLLVAMFAPLIALALGEPDWLFLPVLLLPIAWYAPTWLTRRERRFRRRFVSFAPQDVRAVLSPDVVRGWLGTTGREAPPHSRSAPWLAHAAAGTLNGALFLILLVGIVGVFNWLVVMITLDDHRPGKPAALLDSLRTVRPATLDASVQRWIGTPPMPDATGDRSLADLVTAETRDEVHERTQPLDSLAWDDLFLEVPDSVSRLLDSAAGDPHLAAWRSLASPTIPRTWYIHAITETRGADSAPASYIACRCNRSVQDLWRFGELNRASAVLALSRGRRADAVERLRESVRVAVKLAADPVTLAPAVTTLTHAAASLTALAQTGGNRALVEIAGHLREYGDHLRVAAQTFNGPTAAKAGAWARDSHQDEYLDLVGDRDLPAVHRWGLVRAVIEGACYSGQELYFGIDNEREDLFERAVKRVSDLPDAASFAPFLRQLDFNRNPPGGWQGTVAPILWSLRRVSACERAGILRKAPA